MSFSNELHVNYQYDFVLVGIGSGARDYKLAWELNQVLHIRLVKAKDLVIDFGKDQSITISNFIFKTTHCTFRLLKNKSYAASTDTEKHSQYLLPDLADLDYLLMIQDPTETIHIGAISEKLTSLKDIDALSLLDVNTLLYKDNLIF